MFDFRESFRFHLAHSGYTVGKRAMSAIRAARAERELRAGIEAGTLRVRWAEDLEADTSYLDNEPDSFRARVSHYVCTIDRLETWRNVATGEECRTWEPIGSLFGIGMLPESEDTDRRMFEVEIYMDGVYLGC